MAEPPVPPDTSVSNTPSTPEPVVSRVPWWLSLVRGRPLIPLIVVLTLGFLLLTAIVLRADLRPTSWDIAITSWVQSLPEMPVGIILRWVSDVGYWPWNGLLIVSVAALMAVGRWLPEGSFTAVAGLFGLSAELVKLLVSRPRPTPEFARVAIEHTSYSFPSGHVTSYTVFFGFLFYLAYTALPRSNPFRKLALTLFALLIILVAPSRIWLGAHWASDTIGGYALGFASLLIVIELYRALQKRRTITVE